MCHPSMMKMCHPSMMKNVKKTKKAVQHLSNQYSRSQDEDSKLRRNEAKMVYVRLCKMKAI